ncbi:MAG: serine hydrolase [Chitinophagales bacterium]|nr:serine hydrolase [Chitinophagales bacterium]
MKKCLFAFLLCVSVSGTQAQQFNTTLATMLQDTLNTYVGQISNIKGMSASVYVPGQGIWNGVIGNSYSGSPVTKDMRMGIASNTKLFVATVMLKLAENKIISLDDSLSKWLPTYTNVNPNITIRQLLNHTSGVSDPIFVAPWMDTINDHPTRVFTPTEVLSWLGPPMFQAGTSYGYSNVNYILAGMIAKNATGYQISKLIRDSILTPLNMDSSFYDVEEATNGTIAHRWWNNIDYNDTSRVGLNTAGGCAGALFSTGSEMVQWYTALFDGQIINQSSLNELTDFLPTGSPTYQYGLGFSRETTQGLTYWGHGGSTWGYRSKMIYDSCLHVSVCGLTNCYPSGMEAVTYLLYRVVKNHVPGCSGKITGAATVCSGTDSVSYTVPAIPNASSYIWELPAGVTGSSNTNTIKVNFGTSATSGNIIVRGVNNYGAGGYSTFNITVNAKPITPVISISGNMLTSNAPTGNQWYNSGGIIAGATSNTYYATTNDEYYCIVTRSGCVSDTSNKQLFTDISSVDNINTWQIYPNPAGDDITLNTTGLTTTKLSLNIYNILGREVKNEEIVGNLQKINISALPDGIFIVELRSDETIYKQRLIIKR